MGAFVVFDPYWDAITAMNDKGEAEAYVSEHRDTHFLWVSDATTTDFAGADSLPKPWHAD